MTRKNCRPGLAAKTLQSRTISLYADSAMRDQPPPALTDAALAAEGLACVRGGRMLFSRLSFALDPGQALQVTGPNGAGKSSLMRVLAGLLPAYAGSIAARGAIALSDERPALDPQLPLGRALGWWAAFDRRGDADIAAALAAFDLDGLADVPLRLFSTGQRKRAALARLMLAGAPIWLLDEPLNGLDSASVDRLAAVMARHRDAGGIIVAASHQPLAMPGAAMLAVEAFAP